MTEESDIGDQSKSVENHHDFGIKVPETEEDIEAIRQSAVSLVANINKQNNADGFAHSVKELFGKFGIKPSTGEKQLNKNARDLAYNYRYHQDKSGQEHIVDVSLLGESVDDGTQVYANIYLKADASGNIVVCPGACSMPVPVSRDEHWLHPNSERNFYYVFSEAVGVDPTRDVDEFKKIYPDRELPTNVFITDGKSYKIVPDTKVNQKPNSVQKLLTGIKSFFGN